MRTLSLALIALLLTAPSNADEAEPQIKRFIGCPVYRDTDAGRKSGCWLVTDPASGVQYDVTAARLKPILGQQILVEGVVTATNDQWCGGIALQPVDVSVLPQACKGFVIPAEGYPGRRFSLPAEVLQPTWVPRTLPPPPYDTRQFTIQFELNSDFLVYQYAELIIERAVLYAKASKAKSITITGYAATREEEVSGQKISENLSVAEARARMIQEAFLRLGIPREAMELKWEGEGPSAPAPEGVLLEAAKRRAVITIEP